MTHFDTWVTFPYFSVGAIILWCIAGFLLFKSEKKSSKETTALLVALGGVITIGAFITILWISLERPPLRTLGETRLWYGFFLSAVGLIAYLRWRYKWFVGYSLAMASLFLLITLSNPDTYNKALMPALQSPWFVPHVVVYIFAYALLAASSLVAFHGLYQHSKNQLVQETLDMANNLAYIGLGFLTFGLLFGALWAKEAWGHYWTWDPKETWAFLTWLSYLTYVHLRYRHPDAVKKPLWALALSFGILLICWFGVNYLPSAQQSVHTYTQ
ncbi:cytochrome C assembly protein [Flammeovirga pectinis]|uniref:Cytochrome C assembly protein n=1 Tax=Flammeovirga pectinis TaxID=2494373 RepID=A0A3S9P3Y1_9BACT|nr:cytochrome c biogenesis protein CcsA [Flammeovirga pectinis]AZQ62919.1 cytochrome C assembly protein [Flammeovirga pectinis]